MHEQVRPPAVIDPDTTEENRGTRGRLSYVIARLDRAMRRKIDELVQPYGLTSTQYTALSVLQDSSGLSNAQLARRSYITPQSTIQMIELLERKGLILRTPDPSHRRILRTQLTSRGTDVLARCDEAVRRLEDQMTSELAAEELAVFDRLLRSCVQRLGVGHADL